MLEPTLKREQLFERIARCEFGATKSVVRDRSGISALNDQTIYYFSVGACFWLDEWMSLSSSAREEIINVVRWRLTRRIRCVIALPLARGR